MRIVVGLSRNAEAGEATVAAIRGQGGAAMFVSTDVRSAAEIERAFDEAVRSYGGVDIVVNAAGIRGTGPVTETSPERWAEVVDTNLTGTYLVARAAALRMKEQGRGGAIVNVSAISGFRGPASRAAYGAAKAGVHNLTEAMALDHAGDGIRVNCVAPGPTATPMVGEITDLRCARGSRGACRSERSASRRTSRRPSPTSPPTPRSTSPAPSSPSPAAPTSMSEGAREIPSPLREPLHSVDGDRIAGWEGRIIPSPLRGEG